MLAYMNTHAMLINHLHFESEFHADFYTLESTDNLKSASGLFIY